MDIELIYDLECPNVEAARDVLRSALERVGVSEEWKEWDREATGSPEYASRYGSPTILVNGLDVTGDGSEADANCCRVYASSNGLRGVPSVLSVALAIESAIGAALDGRTALRPGSAEARQESAR